MKQTKPTYVKSLAEFCKNDIVRDLRKIPAGISPTSQWSTSEAGIDIPLDASVPGVVRAPGFFRFVKCCNTTLKATFRKLSEAFTRMDYEKLEQILGTPGPLAKDDLAQLFARPEMKPPHEIDRAFEKNHWPRELLESLLPLVQARCDPNSQEPPSRMWRKGFGYAFVLNGPAGGNHGLLRILPVAHCGPAGVVETLEIELVRVKRNAPLSELIHQGAMYEALGRELAAEFSTQISAVPVEKVPAPQQDEGAID